LICTCYGVLVITLNIKISKYAPDSIFVHSLNASAHQSSPCEVSIVDSLYLLTLPCLSILRNSKLEYWSFSTLSADWSPCGTKIICSTGSFLIF